MATKTKRAKKKEKAIYISRVPRELWFKLQAMGLEARNQGNFETQREFLLFALMEFVALRKEGDGR